jgi:hypothetical protein
MTGKTAAESSASTDNNASINIKAAADSSSHLRDASSNSSDQTPSAAKADTNGQAHASPKKRRKVNHGMWPRDLCVTAQLRERLMVIVLNSVRVLQALGKLLFAFDRL